MKILVLGKVPTVFIEVSKQFHLHLFEFINEVTEIEKDDSSGEIIINGQFELGNYHGVVIANSQTMYNYLWQETYNLPWFCNPFITKNCNNHNYFFSIGKTVGFSVPDSTPSFENGKVSVARDYPKGTEVSYFILPGECIPLPPNSLQIPKRFIRKMRIFLRSTGAKYGVITFIKDRNDNLLLKNFTVTPDWNSIPDQVIKTFLEFVLFTSKVHSYGNGLRN